MSIQKEVDTAGAFYNWGFWFNGQDVHVERGIASLRDQSYVVSKKDSHGDIAHVVALGKDLDEVKQKAILSFNLGFTEANTYVGTIGDQFWFVLGQWLEWKKDQKAAILAIRVWFSDGRVEDVGSVPG